MKIDHDAFLHASKSGQVHLIGESLIRSIKLMPEIGVKDVDFTRLEADVARCLAEVQVRVND